MQLTFKLGAVLTVLLALTPPLLLSEIAGGWTVAARSSFRPESMPDLTGKLALVTGATTGIGRITALSLAKKGATVLVHGRSEAKAAPVLKEIKAAGGKARAVFGDLSSFESVAKLADQITERTEKQLDIAILNAGLCKDCMGQTDQGFEMTKDGYELHIQVNHLSHQLLVEKLLASGVLAKGTRLVAVSSSLESNTYSEGIRYENWQAKGQGYTDGLAYGQSKLANIMMAHEVHKRFGIEAVAVHPGIITTDLGRYVKDNATGFQVGLFQLFRLSCMDSEQGSWTQLWAATQPGLTTGFFVPVGKPATPQHKSFSNATAARCWDESHEVIEQYLPAGQEKQE
eukprot:TRINITY_DN122280_c0_g1_i1.p1 TRINITY_DN122280_c0_g1~~TRINITY_DN122280_c0_g1_i1.p1  ORF type:complete len:343 (+),score=66.76 TRINITY_DN122280_c0_g1_i1:88-1116(+)